LHSKALLIRGKVLFLNLKGKFNNKNKLFLTKLVKKRKEIAYCKLTHFLESFPLKK
jgi:hypothetical protein